MSKILKILTREYSSEYSVKKYTKPKIFPKEIMQNTKSEFSAADKKRLTAKGVRWYIYFDYENPETGKMERQPAIYYNINKKFKDFDERYKWIKKYRNTVEKILKDGYSPYELDNSQLQYSVKNALEFVLELKKMEISKSSFTDYETRTKGFIKYLERKDLHNKSVSLIDKRDINSYLNYVLRNSSPRNRNNVKSVLSALFTKLVQEDFIQYNFIKDIGKLKSKPIKNTAFTQDEVKDLFKFLKEKDMWMYYFCAHVYYGFFRNIEVVRINIADINLSEKLIKSNTKTGTFYKQIPQILIDEFYSNLDLSKYPYNFSLFTKFDKPALWYSPFKKDDGTKKLTSETQRRSYFGKRFNRVALTPLGYSQDYTIYSLRHSAIGYYFSQRLEEYRKNKVPNFEEKALDAVRQITLHKNNETVKNYLREIGYYKTEDWSKYMK